MNQSPISPNGSRPEVTTYWNTISPMGEPIYHALAAEYAKARTGMQAPEDDMRRKQDKPSYHIL